MSIFQYLTWASKGQGFYFGNPRGDIFFLNSEGDSLHLVAKCPGADLMLGMAVAPTTGMFACEYSRTSKDSHQNMTFELSIYNANLDVWVRPLEDNSRFVDLGNWSPDNCDLLVRRGSSTDTSIQIYSTRSSTWRQIPLSGWDTSMTILGSPLFDGLGGIVLLVEHPPLTKEGVTAEKGEDFVRYDLDSRKLTWLTTDGTAKGMPQLSYH